MPTPAEPAAPEQHVMPEGGMSHEDHEDHSMPTPAEPAAPEQHVMPEGGMSHEGHDMHPPSQQPED